MNARAALLALAALTACGGKLVTEGDDGSGGRSGFDGDLPDEESRDAGPPSTPPPAATNDPPPDPTGRVTLAKASGAGWLAVDVSHVYYATYDLIARVPKAGGSSQNLGHPSLMYPGAALAPNGVVHATSSGLARVPLTGGPSVPLPVATNSWAGTIVADAAGVFAQTSDELVRCGPTACAKEPVQGSAGLDVAMDADWVYFRRPTPGHKLSLVRAARGDALPNAYEVLVDEVGSGGFVTTDDTHVYFTRFGAQTGVADGEVVAVAKTPGQAANVLASKRMAARGIFVDATHVYWSEAGAIHALPKAGGPKPVAIASSTSPGRLAVDGARVYWVDPKDGAVYAAILVP